MNIFSEAAKNVPGHLHKGNYADGKGNYCAAGHVMHLIGVADSDMEDDNSNRKGPYKGWSYLLNRVATEMFPDRAILSYIATVNDHDDTTEADVISILEKAAVEWDSRIEN